MNRHNSTRRKFPLKARFQYWFDNRMAGGTLGLIRALVAVSVAFAVLMALIILAFHGSNGRGPLAVIWNSIATVFNAWMPYVEQGDEGFAYMIPTTLVALVGVLFTSVVIGIFTSAIDGRIRELKRGNSLVLEQGHIVVLGFYPGEYTLLRQLILAAGGKPACVVVASDMERDAMEQNISENLFVPRNFRIVCRTADITDHTSLEKCSIETARSVIISPTGERRTIKAILAVTLLLQIKNAHDVAVNAIIAGQDFRIPASVAESCRISAVRTNNVLAKIIAHSCTQTGLSDVCREVLNFEGSEFYLVPVRGTGGLTFMDVMLRLDGGVPAGVFRDGAVILNPEAGFVIDKTDRILVFSEDCDSSALQHEKPFTRPAPLDASLLTAPNPNDTVIIGHNESLPVILSELPFDVSHVILAGGDISDDERAKAEAAAAARDLTLREYDGDLRDDAVLRGLAELAHHIVILNDHSLRPDDADMEAISLLLNLRDIRSRCDLHFNITVEMQRETNQKLVDYGDHTDFLVSSSMSSLILAQLAESPELISVFREILSNDGNELYLKNAGHLRLQGGYDVRSLRCMLLEQGYVFLGWQDEDKNCVFNPPLESVVTLSPAHDLIVLGPR